MGAFWYLCHYRLDICSGYYAGTYIFLLICRVEIFQIKCSPTVNFPFIIRINASPWTYALDRLCYPNALCKCQFYSSIFIRSLWVGLGFSWYSEYSLASTIPRIHTNIPGYNHFNRNVFKSEKFKKKLANFPD